MTLNAAELEQRLPTLTTRCFLLHGAETLLIEEARDTLRHFYSGQGHTDRSRLTVESGFDWSALSQSSQTLSLFAEKRFIELRIPNGKPGDKGSAFLVEFVENCPDDTVLVVLTSKLDKRQLAASWCRIFDQHGVVVEARPVAAAQLPVWIRQRFQREGFQCDSQVAQRLAWYVEGNLLAADQEIRKLTLTMRPGDTLSVADLEQKTSDNSRFNVFVFIDSCLLGDSARSLRILGRLRQEGVEPILLIWSLARELRTLAALNAEMASGTKSGEAFKKHRIWSSRAAMVSSALKRHRPAAILSMLKQTAAVDRLLKGQEPNWAGPRNVWYEIERIALALCGVRLLKSA